MKQMISAQRKWDLCHLWYTETAESWTQEWRAYLSTDDLAFVHQLDLAATIPGANALCLEALCFAVEENLREAV